eukprot:1784016-Rhodomonas_salina.4
MDQLVEYLESSSAKLRQEVTNVDEVGTPPSSQRHPWSGGVDGVDAQRVESERVRCARLCACARCSCCLVLTEAAIP